MEHAKGMFKRWLLRAGKRPWKAKKEKFYTCGGPRRRPCLGQGRGRRIYVYVKRRTCLGGILDITTISMLLPGSFTMSNVDGVPGTSLLAVPEDFAEQLQQESFGSQSSNSELSTAEFPIKTICVMNCHDHDWFDWFHLGYHIGHWFDSFEFI